MGRLKAIFLDRVCNDLGGVGFGIGLDTAGFGRLFGGINVCVGGEFDGTARALSLCHGGAAGAFGVQLLENRITGRLVEVNVQQLGASDLNPPVIHGCFNRDLNLMNEA